MSSKKPDLSIIIPVALKYKAKPSPNSNTSSNTSSSTESFVSDIFTKHATNYNKPDVILGNNIKPKNSSKIW